MNLMHIPGLGGILQARGLNQQAAQQDLQQAQGLIGILSQVQHQQQRQAALQEQQQLKGVLSQSGGDPALAVQALLQAGTPQAVELASKLKGMMPKPAEPYTLGPDQVRMGPNNEPLAFGLPKPEPRQPNPSGLARLMSERDALPQGDPRRTIYDNAIRKESETARQITPPVINVNAGQPRAPVGFQFKEDGTLEPIKGGPRDPTINLAGGRESVYVQRMMMGANQAAKDLANVVQLPLTASTGFLGGRRQGAGLLDASKEVLANKATSQEAQAYNAMATGFQRSLAQIESAGLMPSGSLTHQMDAVLFKEGDTNLTKLHKLAQTRQIVEAGMEVIEANPRVSPDEKAKIKNVLESVRKSVPFTHSDLIRLQMEQEKNPTATLGSVLKQSSGGAPKEGDTGTSKSGKPTVFRNGRWEYQ